MVALIKNISPSELEPLTSQEDKDMAKVKFQELVSMIKHMGNFFSKLLIYVFTGKWKDLSKRNYHTLSLIMNTMLLPMYIFERYVSLLAKILLLEEQQRWIERRKEMHRLKQTFSDLIYLNKYIGKEERRNLIRKNTQFTIHSSRAISKREIDVHIDSKKVMDINEFLSHLELQVNLDLDDVFNHDLKFILEYFQAVDSFIEKTFPNSELEIKIDLMRLILRMSNSTKFMSYIYVLDAMKVEFLNECQIFALFCQVLLSELKKPKLCSPPKNSSSPDKYFFKQESGTSGNPTQSDMLSPINSTMLKKRVSENASKGTAPQMSKFFKQLDLSTVKKMQSDQNIYPSSARRATASDSSSAETPLRISTGYSEDESPLARVVMKKSPATTRNAYPNNQIKVIEEEGNENEHEDTAHKATHFEHKRCNSTDFDPRKSRAYSNDKKKDLNIKIVNVEDDSMCSPFLNSPLGVSAANADLSKIKAELDSEELPPLPRVLLNLNNSKPKSPETEELTPESFILSPRANEFSKEKKKTDSKETPGFKFPYRKSKYNMSPSNFSPTSNENLPSEPPSGCLPLPKVLLGPQGMMSGELTLHEDFNDMSMRCKAVNLSQISNLSVNILNRSSIGEDNAPVNKKAKHRPISGFGVKHRLNSLDMTEELRPLGEGESSRLEYININDEEDDDDQVPNPDLPVLQSESPI